MKKGIIIQEPGQPLKFSNIEEVPAEDTVANTLVTRVLDTIKAYQAEARNLLKTRYAGLKDVAPLHLREPCNSFVLCCSDGLCVRYDRAPDEKTVARMAIVPETLAEIVPRFSEGFIHVTSDPKAFVPGQSGPAIILNIGSPTSEVTEVARWFPSIVVSTNLPDDFITLLPPARPLCIASVQSEIDFDLAGIIEPFDSPLNRDDPDNDHFVAHTRMRLTVGWESIELYLSLDIDYWDPTRAPMWAEIDILAAAAQANLRTQAYRALDSRGETRKQYVALLAEFDTLLTGPEEPVHQFLKKHPVLLCPTAQKQWSKLPFGDRFSDFVFREAPNDYLLVEIEAPIREIFRKDGQQREELTHAINQISDWVQYIEDNRSEVESSLGLVGISTSPRTLVVIGRSAALSDENRRKITAIQNQHGKLRILTYDDLLASARANLERILGPLSITGENTQIFYFKPKSVAL